MLKAATPFKSSGAQVAAMRLELGESAATISAERTGTASIQLPVETAWIGVDPISSTLQPSISAASSGLMPASRKRGGSCVMTNSRSSPLSVMVTGMRPAVHSWLMIAGSCSGAKRPVSTIAKAAAIVGWPAKGSSARGVKMRAR